MWPGLGFALSSVCVALAGCQKLGWLEKGGVRTSEGKSLRLLSFIASHPPHTHTLGFPPSHAVPPTSGPSDMKTDLEANE